VKKQGHKFLLAGWRRKLQDDDEEDEELEAVAAGKDDGTYYTTKYDEATIQQRELEDAEEINGQQQADDEVSDVSDNDFEGIDEESEEEGKMSLHVINF
jgi:hypothetical protein